MSDELDKTNCERLEELLRLLRMELADRGVIPESTAAEPLEGQFIQIKQAVLGQIDHCQAQMATSLRAEAAMHESKQRLWQFIEDAPVAIAMFNRDMQYLAVSHRWIQDYGLTGRNILGKSHYDIFPEISDEWKAVHQRALSGEVIRAVEDRFVRQNGTIQWLQWEVRPWYLDSTVGGIIIFTEDITAFKSVQEQLERQNRGLQLLSSTNEALIRATSEPSLLQRVCDIAIDPGGYRLAWVGYLVDDESKTVRPQAYAGVERGYLEGHTFTWDEEKPEGHGPLGRAIRLRQLVSADDFASEREFGPWREAALARGFRAGIVLPLVVNDEVLGIFALYQAAPYHFTPEECTLLKELADDLAFGIVTLRTRHARREAEQALQKSEAKYRTIIETAQEGIWILDRDLRAVYVNKRMAEMLGYTVDEVTGKNLFDFISSENRAAMEEHIARRRHGVTEVYEFQFQRRDGSDLWVLISGSPLKDDEGAFVGSFGMLTDLTERHYAEEFQREFARKTIEAATEGKLIVSETEAILQIVGPELARWEITDLPDLETVRHGIADVTAQAGMDEQRVGDLVLCVSEAATNAYKHAGSGTCTLHRIGDLFSVVIVDHGPGIRAINLPELALKRGYTTAISLGMGYKAMITLTDRVYLATGPGGTMVCIQMAIEPPPSPLATDTFPAVDDDW